MSSGLRGLAKDTVVYGLSSIVGRFLNWLLVPMYVRVLATPGEYGIVTNLYGWTALLLAVLTFGMETNIIPVTDAPIQKFNGLHELMNQIHINLFVQIVPTRLSDVNLLF